MYTKVIECDRMIRKEKEQMSHVIVVNSRKKRIVWNVTTFTFHFPMRSTSSTLSRWFGGGVNDNTVGSTTELKAIPRASQHAIHWIYRIPALIDSIATPFKSEF